MEKQGETGFYPGTPFSDIGASPFREAIARCYARGWLLGVASTKFVPERPMERGMLAAALYRAAGSPALDRRGFFFDVKPRAYFSDGVDWCACQGLMEGVGGGRFLPKRPLIWEELALALWRRLGSPSGDPSDGAAQGLGQAAAWGRRQGLIPPGKLGRAVTRGEAAGALDVFWPLP